MFQSVKSRYYLTIYDQFYLNCSGVCKVHYYISDSGGKMNYRFNIIAAGSYTIDRILETMFKFMLS